MTEKHWKWDQGSSPPPNDDSRHTPETEPSVYIYILLGGEACSSFLEIFWEEKQVKEWESLTPQCQKVRLRIVLVLI